MADWKNKFSSISLRRGHDLVKAKAVLSLVESDPYYNSVIYDGGKYYSCVRIEDGEADKFECSCQTFRNSGSCKHIAALLYTIEEKHPGLLSSNKDKEEEENSSETTKFTFEDDDKPHYLNFGTSLENFRATDKVYQAAREIIKKDALSSPKIEIHQIKSSSYLTYQIYVDYAGKTADVSITLTRKGITNIKCENEDSWYIMDKYITKACANEKSDSSGKITLCVHKTAALLSFLDYMKKNRDVIDFSDKNADLLITNFKKERKKIEEEKPVSLVESTVDMEITLTSESRSSGLAFSITISKDGSKYYKIHDIESLKETIDKNRKYVLGKNNIIDFSSARLTQKAEKILDFIRKAEIEIILRTRGDYRPGHLRESIDFFNNIDTFFETMGKTPFFFGVKPIMGCRETDATFNMKISEMNEGGNTVGIHVTGTISGRYESTKYTYWFQDGYLNRTEKSSLGSAGALSEIADDDGSFSFDVGMKLIDNFYQRVLPELRKYGKIEDDAFDKIEDKLQEPPKAVFYLDWEREKITCKAVIKTNEEELVVSPHYYSIGQCDTKYKGLEKEMREALEEYNLGLFYLNEKKWTLYSITDDSLYNFLHSGIPLLMEIGTVNASDRVKNMIIKKMPTVTSTIDIDENDDSILNFTLDLGGLTVEELVEILNSYNEKKKYHRLKSGDFISFEGMNLNSLRDLFFSSGIPIKDFVDGKMHLPLYRALYLDQILQNQNGITMEGGQKYRRLIKEFKTISESDYEIPSSLSSTMRPYQKDGLRWMRVLFDNGFGGILADDMGLGKTIQALSLILSLKEEGKGANTLIISPASLVYNWKAECTRFTPSLSAVTVAGTKAERKAIIKDHASYDILITSYDLLKRDIALYEGIKFDNEIIDEAQFIKNHNTAQAKAVRAVSSKHRLALTGTPIENRLLELWSIFEYLMPGFLFNQENFKKYIANPIEKSSDKDASERLKKLTGPFILRRIKSDVLKELPEKIEETRVTPLSGEQKKLYTAEVAKAMGMLKKNKDFNGQKIEILAELTRIRQICCDPSLVYDSYKGESAKREAVLDLISSAIDGGHKILLFSQFTSMLALLENDLNDRGIKYYKIIGDTGKAKRLELVDAFNSDTTPLFLISLKAGGTGLNLTSADIVIHYDPWWNVAVQNQATDRAHRIGQTKRVTVYKMICENTIEEKIVKLQETKKNLADEIVSGDNISLSSLSKEDLMELLDISQMA